MDHITDDTYVIHFWDFTLLEVGGGVLEVYLICFLPISFLIYTVQGPCWLDTSGLCLLV